MKWGAICKFYKKKCLLFIIFFPVISYSFFIKDKFWKIFHSITLIDGATIFNALITYKIHPKYNIFIKENVKSTKRIHKKCKFSWKLGNRERTLSYRNLHGSITIRLKSWYSSRLRCKICKQNAAVTQRRVTSKFIQIQY